MEMKNLGEKLKEARIEKGLSVRDVAEATRLRIDVIENMEAGSFDYKLPEIYKRGFLRIYANFLRLDENSVMDQYALLGRRDADDARKNGILSRKFAAPAKDERPEGAPASVESRFDDADEEISAHSDDSLKYFKLGGLIVALLLAVIAIILIITSFSNSSAPESNPDLAPNADVSISTDSLSPISEVSNAAINAQEEKPAECIIKLSALGDTYIRIHPMDEKDNVLYIGPLQSGESKEFKTSKPLTLRVTDAEKISITRDGKKLDLKGAKGLIKFNVPIK